MPNHVKNKMIFDSELELSELKIIMPKEFEVDFNLLIPKPDHIYDFIISGEDERDFQQGNCWSRWNRVNWGTKWNGYQAKSDGNYIQFDTAWSVPYPVIIAFSKRVKRKFTLKYFDEGHCFWGIEEWKAGERISKDFKNESNKKSLCIELQGYDPG